MWDLLLLSNIMWKLEKVLAGFSWDTARFLNVGGDFLFFCRPNNMSISHTQNLHFQTTLIQQAKKHNISLGIQILWKIPINRHKARAGPVCGSGLFFCSLGEIHGKRNPYLDLLPHKATYWSWYQKVRQWGWIGSNVQSFICLLLHHKFGKHERCSD